MYHSVLAAYAMLSNLKMMRRHAYAMGYSYPVTPLKPVTIVTNVINVTNVTNVTIVITDNNNSSLSSLQSTPLTLIIKPFPVFSDPQGGRTGGK